MPSGLLLNMSLICAVEMSKVATKLRVLFFSAYLFFLYKTRKSFYLRNFYKNMKQIYMYYKPSLLGMVNESWGVLRGAEPTF